MLFQALQVTLLVQKGVGTRSHSKKGVGTPWNMLWQT